MKTWCLLILLVATVCSPRAGLAAVYDHLFRNGMEVPTDAPASDAEAARFLTQATFGPSPASILQLRALGYAEWFDEQLSAAPTLERPFVQQVVAARTAAGMGVGMDQRRNRFLWAATFGPDQLRQRMGWELSQIFVVSAVANAVFFDVVPLSEYADLLVRDAFVPYRHLLGDVTYSPSMGKYLNAFRNQKPSANTQPDENFAREVMQLFSVGLIERNLDFSPVLVGNVAVPTYDQSVIGHTAKVFTGFTYSDAPINPPNFNGGGLTQAGAYNPMACWGTELFPPQDMNMRHDITGDDGTTGTPKTVLGGMTIPSGQTCGQDVSDELDILAGHSNVAPFIARQLIERFVTSNPSPAYIERIARVFNDNGAPEHAVGDLGAVVRALLMDPEARDPPSGATWGKVREPLMRLIAMWRAWEAQAPPVDAYGEFRMVPGNFTLIGAFAQDPLGSPTVFNFYSPDYQPPGYLSDNNLYAPELQIVNETTVYSTTSAFYFYTRDSYVGINLPPENRPIPTDKPSIDLRPLWPLAVDPDAMVDLVNDRMLGGQMTDAMHGALTEMLVAMSTNTVQEQAWSLILVTVNSPQFAAVH